MELDEQGLLRIPTSVDPLESVAEADNNSPILLSFAELDRPNNPGDLDGELVVGNALRTVTLVNPNLVVNLLPWVQQMV